MNISGGTFINGIALYNSGNNANFIGSGLSYVYNGFSNNNPYQTNADSFTISGTIGGVLRSYNLYLVNFTGTGNSTPRLFTFNAVTAPEPGTLVLLSTPALLGGIVLRRRLKVLTTTLY